MCAGPSGLVHTLPQSSRNVYQDPGEVVCPTAIGHGRVMAQIPRRVESVTCDRQALIDIDHLAFLCLVPHSLISFRFHHVCIVDRVRPLVVDSTV